MSTDPTTLTSATGYVARLIAGYQAEDAEMMDRALRDAEAAGLTARHLLTVLVGAVAGLLADQGFGVEDSRALLLALAAAEEAERG